jgi:hypothetical protein
MLLCYNVRSRILVINYSRQFRGCSYAISLIGKCEEKTASYRKTLKPAQEVPVLDVLKAACDAKKRHPVWKSERKRSKFTLK